VETALRSLQARLKLIKKLPENGLALFYGLVVREGEDPNHPKMLSIAIEPPRPLQRSLYFCGSRFQTDLLKEQLEDGVRYGFCIVDGSGADFYIVSGNRRELVFTLADPNLPKKHNKGGQSAPRFGRIHDEKRDAYLKKVSEKINATFIDPETHKVIVEALIFAGCGDVKTQLAKCQELDPRVASRVVRCVDIQYDGDAGLSEALERSSDLLSDLEYNAERKVISEFFRIMSNDVGTACFGPQDVFYALEAGAVETLILYQDLPLRRFTLQPIGGAGEVVATSRNPSAADKKPLIVFADSAAKIPQLAAAYRSSSASRSGSSSSTSSSMPTVAYEVVEEVPVLDWLVENAIKLFGVGSIKLVSDSSAEGHQFAQGFGGLCAMMRYRLEQLPSMADDDDDLDEHDANGSSDEDDFDFDY
jgi:peptide chain release factor subunit 1